MEVNDNDGNPLRGHDLGCGGTEHLHSFCSPCIANLWWCPLCRRAQRLCKALPLQETQDEDLTLQTLRTLIRQNVWNDGATEDSPDVEWLDVLTDEDPAKPPPRPPWRAPTWALPDPDADPTVYVPDHEDYNDAPRGSLPPIGNLPDSWGYVSPTNQNNYRNIVVTLTTRLPIAFGWLVGYAEPAMGIARGAHGAEWGDSFQRGGAMTPGATERLMAAYLRWRGIPPPRSLQSLIQRTLQPHVPPPQPGTYGNAAVARMMARGTWLDGSSYSPRRPTATITTPPPRSRATTATRATNVRVRTPAATSSTSPNPFTSAPPTPAAEPHQQHAADVTLTTGDRAPSRAGTPQSPRQERASKRAAQRQPTQHHAATGSRGHRASPARSGALPGPTNTGAVGTQPGQPPSSAQPHRVPAPSPTGSLQPLTPPVAPAHGPRPAASQAATTQAQPEPRPHHGTPDWPAADPTYMPSDNLPRRTHTATPTDASAARPSDAGRPHTHGPTGGLTSQASATSGTEDLPTTTHGGPVPQQHHAPPTRPPAKLAKPSSPGRPAPGPGPGPDLPRTAAPANAPQPTNPGSLPEPPPVAGGHAKGALPPADDGAEPPTPPTQPQRNAPAVGAEGLQRPWQRMPTPAPMREPGGGTDQPSVRSADLTNETAHRGNKALADGQPDVEPEGPAPDTGCADGPHRPSAADHAGAAPRTNLATRAGVSTPGEALQRDPPETSAGSEARETMPDTSQRADEGGTSPSGHNRDDDSFDAFMDSCRDDPGAVQAPETPHVHPEPQCDQADDTPLTVPQQAHLQQDYTTLGQIATTGEAQVTASGAADRTTNERNAPNEGTRVEAGTNTASEPVAPPPGAAPPWGRGHVDYARLEGDASHPSEQAEQEATQDLGFRIPRLVTGPQLELAVRIRWVLSSRSRHLAEGTRTMADVKFGHWTGYTPPATMDHPGQWRYVATRLIAHMGAYSPDEMNGLHWRWHQRAALRIRTAMQDHNMWDIPGSPGYQGHAAGHRRPRSQDVPEPPGRRRAETHRNSHGVHHPVGVPPLAHTAAPCGRSPHRGARAVRAPRGCKATRRSSAKGRGTLTDPVAAAARRPPQRDELFSRRIWTGTTGALATPTLGEHHRPPTPDTGPRGPCTERSTSPPFSRRPSASGKQRFKRTLARRRAKRPAHLTPPSRGQQPIRYREDHTPRTCDQGSPRPTPALRKGRGGSPPRSQEAARPRRAHRGSRDTTRADQGRTQR